MESTGVYWWPVWNILERPKYGLRLMLVNPAMVRALQGCKTDRIDARRIAEFLQYGLLRGSFIPPKPIRQLRELTRMRVHIQQDRNRVINRIGRLLETVNIKLGSVASNIVGKSGRAMLEMLAAGGTVPSVWRIRPSDNRKQDAGIDSGDRQDHRARSESIIDRRRDGGRLSFFPRGLRRAAPPETLRDCRGCHRR